MMQNHHSSDDCEFLPRVTSSPIICLTRTDTNNLTQYHCTASILCFVPPQMDGGVVAADGDGGSNIIIIPRCYYIQHIYLDMDTYIDEGHTLATLRLDRLDRMIGRMGNNNSGFNTTHMLHNMGGFMVSISNLLGMNDMQ